MSRRSSRLWSHENVVVLVAVFPLAGAPSVYEQVDSVFQDSETIVLRTSGRCQSTRLMIMRSMVTHGLPGRVRERECAVRGEACTAA
jgi:hypothetical protein